jgi:hypothetical protein
MIAEETVGKLFRYLLFHMKSVAVRLEWSTAIHEFRQQDKNTVNRSINKVNLALKDVLGICSNPDIGRQIQKELNNVDHLADFMALVEQTMELKDEDFKEVVDLIETYLQNKYYSKNNTIQPCAA